MSELFRIKPLKWQGGLAHVLDGFYYIGYAGTMFQPYGDEEPERIGENETACQAHHEARMREHLEPVQADPLRVVMDGVATETATEP